VTNFVTFKAQSQDHNHASARTTAVHDDFTPQFTAYHSQVHDLPKDEVVIQSLEPISGGRMRRKGIPAPGVVTWHIERRGFSKSLQFLGTGT